MTEILTESFCERCGTRYTFESARPRIRMKGVKVLSRGLKNFVLSDDTSMDEAMAAARSQTDRESTASQLDAFHKTFNFCMSCRQYTCPNCWNEVEARCLSCAPHLGHEIMPAPFPHLDATAGMAVMDRPATNGSNGVHRGAREDVDANADLDIAARLAALTGGEDAPEAAFAEAVASAEAEAQAAAVAAAEAEAQAAAVAAAEAIAAAAAAEAVAAAAAEAEAIAAATAAAEAEAVAATAAAEAEAQAAVAAAAESAAAAAEAEAIAAATAAAEAEAIAVAAAAAAEAAAATAAAEAEAVAAAAQAEAAAAAAEAVATAAAEAEAEIAARLAELAAAAMVAPAETQPTWRMVAPDPSVTSPIAPPADSAYFPAAASAADPNAEPQWPTRPGILGSRRSEGLPFLGRSATAQGGLEALWAESAKEVVTGTTAGKVTSAVQPCVSCGLSLSASARFCRRCGTPQAS